MNTQAEPSNEDVNFWEKAVSHDKCQFFTSFVMAASGLVLSGVGIKTIIDGDLGTGLLEITMGCGVAGALGTLGVAEVQDYAYSSAKLQEVRSTN